ncbi:PHP domain-containing protein [Homoserinibacter sp. YIM 151385]|uniref:PHP domain-containing protein n=1 Tax=Homoserinibacter sp. YIM 151385 TaxID=2985506 RepID=UPI0022F01E03|nr:PHP domain-containing protein [Homoserinibacter sp. YIM 151385]WBU38146.1 PHP domain-containing protein [Homoserinibacter sp. YIM 151385]
MPATGRIDLHAHSSVSDGTQSPAELVAAAAEAGLEVVALTDHDSTAGWAEALDAASGMGVTVLPGMELSTQLDFASVHVLAYLVDPAHPRLVAETARIREERLHRAESMVARIGRDYELSWDDVLAQTTPGGTIGRPHIADALVARGHVADRTAAFQSILHWRGGYYAPHEAPSPLAGVELVVEAGGVPVIAHPGARGPDHVLTRRRLEELVDAGLFGVEIEHRDNPPAAREKWSALARRYGLVETGSSDYHGAGKPNLLGEHTTSRAVYEAILARGTGTRVA